MITSTIRLDDETYNILENERGYESQSQFIRGLLLRYYRDKPTTTIDSIRETVERIMDMISTQREEILAAFVAKYGCQPEEIEQVVRLGRPGEEIFSVRKKHHG